VRFLYRRDRSISTPAYCHGILIALANISVVIVLIFWRVLAAFPPYLSW
jgi:hypothetical protein